MFVYVKYMVHWVYRIGKATNKNKSDGKPRKLNFTFSCSYFMNI